MVIKAFCQFVLAVLFFFLPPFFVCTITLERALPIYLKFSGMMDMVKKMKPIDL